MAAAPHLFLCCNFLNENGRTVVLPLSDSNTWWQQWLVWHLVLCSDCVCCSTLFMFVFVWAVKLVEYTMTREGILRLHFSPRWCILRLILLRRLKMGNTSLHAQKNHMLNYNMIELIYLFSFHFSSASLQQVAVIQAPSSSVTPPHARGVEQTRESWSEC